MLSKRELKAVMEQYNIRPNRMLGQNFLIDTNMQEKLLYRCELTPDDVVFEIGAGFGALTFTIAEQVRGMYAVEKDRAISEWLRECAQGHPNIVVISGDIRDVSMKKLLKKKQCKVIGNLPYSVTTPVLSYLLEHRTCISTIFITVQKEVGKRLVASPGSKDYGALSIYAQFYTEPQELFLIRRGVFYPVPAVDSLFMKLAVRAKPPVRVPSEKFFFRVTRAAFGKRRKTILNALDGGDVFAGEKAELVRRLNAVDIDPMKRPEQLSLNDFARIANSLR
jgi:16S rRNA (adenine1518-N6/adenine1519-N6)-dimethyltransferase